MEVRYKLVELGARGDDLERLIANLISENYLNEERFALNYATSKVKYNKWGKSKIIRNLKQRQISDYLIKRAMTEIESALYESNMGYLIQRALEQLKDKHRVVKSQKITEALTRKGYAYAEFSAILNQALNAQDAGD